MKSVGEVLLAILRYGRPRRLMHFGSTPGDDLLCTAVLRAGRARGWRGVWMMTRYPAIFAKSPDVDGLVPVADRYRKVVRRLRGELLTPHYTTHDPVADQDKPPTQHILAEMCARAGLSGAVELRPRLYWGRQDRPVPPSQNASRPVVAIQTSGAAAAFPMRNKEWFIERYQEVADRLGRDCRILQVGSAQDPRLGGTEDLRGRTSIRQTAKVLAECNCFVGQVGFLMHLSRAAECRAVIVYGGREAPWQSGYTCNVNLYSPVPCAPCWKWNTCGRDRECMRRISAAEVTDAVQRQLARSAQPLEVDCADIGAPTTTPQNKLPTLELATAGQSQGGCR